MIKLFEVGHDWDDESVLISQHKTKKAAENRLNKEIKNRVKTLGYVRCIIMRDDFLVYDYGRWNKFLVLKGVEEVLSDDN